MFALGQKAFNNRLRIVVGLIRQVTHFQNGMLMLYNFVCGGDGVCFVYVPQVCLSKITHLFNSTTQQHNIY